MNDSPLVSLLIPCYNHALFLEDCLNSLLAQSYQNIELLICDDCSPDNSFAIIAAMEAQLRARFPRVEIMQNAENCGVTKNVNRLLRMAKGVYVKTLASDDAMAPDAIEKMVAYFQLHPEIDVVVSNGYPVAETQRYPHFSSTKKLYETAPDLVSEGLFFRVARNNCISAPAAMVRRQVYDTFGLYDETLKVEDYEFWLRILRGGARFGFLDMPLLYYRINANSMTSMTANAALELRRKRIYESEISTLEKFRGDFPPEVYADIVLSRMLTERQISDLYCLWNLEKQVRIAWNTFDGWRYLPKNSYKKYRLLGYKQNLKHFLLSLKSRIS